VALRAGPRKPGAAVAPPRHWEAVARTWIGILSGVIVAVSAAWLLTVYIHAWRVLPAEKVLVDSLKEKAKTDAEIQKILQPELDRQHNAAMARRYAYSRGGGSLLLAAAALMAWLTWLRPKHGAAAGVPAVISKFLEKPPDKREKVKSIPRTTRNQSDDSAPIA
jgi:hypothetical protein